MAAFVGTVDDDTIIGSNSPDTINGEGGADIIFGYGDGSGVGGTAPTVSSADGGPLDDDSLIGGGGNDTLQGGGGGDAMTGGDGNDRLLGGAGEDRLLGGAGLDEVHGGAGDDRVVGGNGRDRLFGDAGNDTIAGDASNDLIEGLAGTDRLSGEGGKDRLYGGAGTDRLSGGGGDDQLFGEAGDDTILGGSGHDRIVGGFGDDEGAGGAGTDTLVLSGRQADYAVSFLAGKVTVGDLKPLVDGNDGTDAFSGIERLRFSDGTVYLVANQAPVADAERFAGREDTPLVIPTAALLEGDSDPDGDHLTLSGVGGAVHGTVALAAGAVTFTPEANYAGSARFTYTISDGHGGFDTATVRLNIARVEDAPRRPADQDHAPNAVEEDAADGTLVGITARALDPDRGDTVTYSLINDAGGRFAIDATTGVVTVADGSLLDFETAASHTIRVQASDGTLTSVRSFSIAITDAAEGVRLVQLGDLDGNDGFRLLGGGGYSVSSAGDVNGDGFDDVIVGDPGADASYVVFGKAAGFAASLDLATLDGSNGFRLVGQNGSGHAVSAADVNGDGFDDLIVGTTFTGYNYVVFGKASGFAGSLDLSTLDGSNGFRTYSSYVGHGRSINSAGDINGDGFDDLVIGIANIEPYFSYGIRAGAAYVVFGKAGGFAPVEGSSPLAGVADGDELGSSASSAGDVNGDGFDDVIVGAPGADPNGDRSGIAYVVFGEGRGLGTHLASRLDGSNGFELNKVGASHSDLVGSSVSTAGDVNGDGFGDLLIAAPGDGAAGATYLVFGKASGFTAGVNVAAFDGSDGFRLVAGASAVSSAGDVNGDGYDDMIVGARGADLNGTDSGGAFILFGKAGGFAATLNLDGLTASDGLKLAGAAAGDGAGFSVRSAGDVNGDGFDDVIVGRPGAAYVVFGEDLNGQVTHLGTAAGETVTGSSGDDVIVAGLGDDTVVGGAGDDVLRGGGGNDVLVFDPADTGEVDGGLGVDTLRIEGGGVVLDLTAINGTAQYDLFSGIETVDLSGTGNNTLILDRFDVLRLSNSAAATGDANTLIVDGDAGDQVEASGGWVSQGVDGGYEVFTLGTATLRIDSDIATTTPQNAAPGPPVDDNPRANTVAENTLAGNPVGIAVNAVDPDAGDVVTYSLTDSAGGRFAVNAATGVVTVANGALLDFETATSHTIVVQASDGANISSRSFTIAVSDVVDEAPAVVILRGDLDGSNGFRLIGGSAPVPSASSAGDVNGDGFDDIIVNGGVVFGKAGAFSATLDLSALDGSDGFRFASAGDSVSAAGDINGDGFGDLIIGAGAAAYVVLGMADGFAASLDLSALDGSDGFRLDAEAGVGAVSSAGDVNGDGFDDFLVGAPGAGPNGPSSGAAYLVFGGAGGFAASFDLASLDGSDGFRLAGAASGDQAGYSVSSAGDVDGDGFDDLIVGAIRAHPYGAAYVVHGKADGFAANLDLSALDGDNGFELVGELYTQRAGYSVSSAGDVNGDGFDDVIVAGPTSFVRSYSEGESYVVFGNAEGFAHRQDLSTLDGSNGFRLEGRMNIDFGFSTSVSSAGDVNGDGFDDLVVGTMVSDDPNYATTAYVVFGKAAGFAAALDLTALAASDGFRVAGGGYGGDWVSSAGDVNGDGFDDLIAGSAGGAAVVFGGDFNSQVTHMGTSAGETVTGSAGNDVIVAGLGDDTVVGGASNDVLQGGGGDDTLVFDPADTREVDGGLGTDTLRVDGSGVVFDLTTVNAAAHYHLYTGIETIDLSGAGDNTLELDQADLLHLSDSAAFQPGGANTLIVDGNVGDEVHAAGGWVSQGVDGAYEIFTLGAATLRVDTDIDVLI
jgi:hypothetical protein